MGGLAWHVFRGSGSCFREKCASTCSLLDDNYPVHAAMSGTDVGELARFIESLFEFGAGAVELAIECGHRVAFIGHRMENLVFVGPQDGVAGGNVHRARV